MSQITYTITGQPARYGGPCVKCGKHVDPKRNWEAMLLTAPARGQRKRQHAVAHAGCLGGKIGGVNRRWRGPDTITVRS